MRDLFHVHSQESRDISQADLGCCDRPGGEVCEIEAHVWQHKFQVVAMTGQSVRAQMRYSGRYRCGTRKRFEETVLATLAQASHIITTRGAQLLPASHVGCQWDREWRTHEAQIWAKVNIGSSMGRTWVVITAKDRFYTRERAFLQDPRCRSQSSIMEAFPFPLYTNTIRPISWVNAPKRPTQAATQERPLLGPACSQKHHLHRQSHCKDQDYLPGILTCSWSANA